MKSILEMTGTALSQALKTKALLIVTVLAISLLLQQAGSVSSVPSQSPVGAARNGLSVWHEVQGLGLLTVTPETAVSGNEVNFDFTKEASATSSDMQIAFIFEHDEGFVDSIRVFRTLQRTRTVFNTSSLFNETNSSYYDVIINVGEEPYLAQEWVTLPTTKTTINGKNYYAASFNAGEVLNVNPRAKKFGGIIKYSVAVKPTSEDWQSPSRIEIDPIINATAANITSNSDLNLTVSDVRFVDGKLLLAVGNRTNITAYDTVSDNDFTNNPTWKPSNISASTTFGTGSRVSAHEGFFNLTLKHSGVGNTEAIALLHPFNISVPSSAGIMMHGYVNENSLTNTNNWGAGICFSVNWDRTDGNTTNPDANMPCYGGQNSFNGIGFQVVNSPKTYRVVWSSNAVTGTSDFGSGKVSNTINEWTMWTNCSHARFDVNYSSTNGLSSGLVTLGNGIGQNSCSGKVALNVFSQGTAGTSTLLVYNLSAANATQFGQPFNLTNGRFETNVLNSTAGLASVKVSNQTHRYANTAAKFFAYDRNHNNQQSIDEGSFSGVGTITGIGINGTFTPIGSTPITTATELTSIKVEWAETNVAATEEEGDNAIEQSIDTVLPSATKYKTQKVYIVNASNNQWQGTVDYLVVQNNPPKRWVLNYITTGESYLNASNLSNIVYVRELANKSISQIRGEIEGLLDTTKG